MIREFLANPRFKAPLLVTALGLSLALGGCGGDSGYDKPESTQTAPLAGQTQSVLIDAPTLNRWVQDDYVNNETSWEKVVILDVTTAEKYAAGHIPGAQLWDTSAQVMNRVEGPVETVNMVLDGPSMDAMLQTHGIDERTTVVLTATKGTPTYQVGRAYFLLRYWGFPKENIKVLNGFNSAWTDAGLAMTTVAPTIVPSSYSVKSLPQFRDDLRGSLSEVIAAVENQTMQVVDFRGDAMPGATAGVFADDHDGDNVASTSGGDADVVVFEGTMKGGKYFSWNKFLNPDGSASTADDLLFKGTAQLTEELAAAGIDNSKKIISMCRTAMIASAGFLVVDGILGWDVMVYDGSWSQWGSLSDNASKGGKLPAGSLWATDIPELMDVIVYNADAGKLIEPARINAPSAEGPYDPTANAIEAEDRAYFEAPPASAPGATSGGGGGGC